MSGVFNTLVNPIKNALGSLTGRNAAKSAQQQAEQQAKLAYDQQAAIEATRKQEQQALQNMQANSAVDLSTNNLTSVIAGGTADVLGVDSGSLKKKKQATGLASSLGLNV